MPEIPLWAIGKHVTSVLFTPLTVNTTTGALTETTPTRQFFGVLQDIEVMIDTEFENISSMDRPQKNMVPIEDGQGVRITELEKSAGTCIAAVVAFQTRYWKAVVTRGVNTFTMYLAQGSYRMNTSGKGKILAQIEFMPIDPGTTTSAVAYS